MIIAAYLINSGILKPDRVEAFKMLVDVWGENKGVNQYLIDNQNNCYGREFILGDD